MDICNNEFVVDKDLSNVIDQNGAKFITDENIIDTISALDQLATSIRAFVNILEDTTPIKETTQKSSNSIYKRINEAEQREEHVLPPEIMERVLCMVAGKDIESMLGDFDEMYAIIYRISGKRKAICWYLLHIIRSCPTLLFRVGERLWRRA